MKRVLLLVLFAAALVAVYVSFLRKNGEPKRETLIVFCGSSMQRSIEKIHASFREENPGIELLIDYGGSETLLPRILAGAKCDVFVCHDPFGDKVKEAGLLQSSIETGVLRPIVLVRPGNPKAIKGIEGLAREGLQLGIGDPRYSTCGELFVEMLHAGNLYEPVMANVKFEGRAHGEIVNGLINGPLDAVVVWNFIAGLYAGKCETVETGKTYRRINVTLVGMANAPHPTLRDTFLAYCNSARAKEIFQQDGYR